MIFKNIACVFLFLPVIQPSHAVPSLLSLKPILFKYHLFYKSVQFFSLIVLLCLICQQTSASEKGNLNLIVDKANARLYLNGENKGVLDVDNRTQLQLPEGYYRVFIERPIKNSVYSYQASREVMIKPGDSLVLNIELQKTLSPAWKQHFQTILIRNKNNKQHFPVLNHIEMLEIPSGEFMMGSHDVMFAKPAHPVRVAAFKLSKNEITYELYDLFVQQTGYDIPMDSWGRANQPVTNVSWYDAQLFIKWLNTVTTPEKPYRLPTEAEWEYAARAGTQTPYWWGNHKGRNRANCSDCANPWYRQTVPVGTFSANPFGLNDTSGNVYEWTQDCWNSHFEQAPQDGSARLSGYCKYRVIRGGCWYFNHEEIASASRTWNTATKRDSTIGFRLAQDY